MSEWDIFNAHAEFVYRTADLFRRIQGRRVTGDALDAAERAVAAAPEDAELRARLGSLQVAQGEVAAGIGNLRRAAEGSPRSGLLWNELGIALATAGEGAEAVKTLRRALMLAPDVPEIHNNFGNALRQTGDLAGAIVCYRAALARRADYTEAEANLGVALQEAGELDTAIGHFDAVLQRRPDDGATWTHRGAALAALGRLGEAEDSHRRAIAAAPDRADGYNNYGILLKDLGRLDEARAMYSRALDLAPGDAGVHSNLLMCLCYDPRIDAAAMIAEHRAWAERNAPAGPEPDFAGLAAHPDEPLRVGYLSPDFRTHSVAWFLDAIFRQHDPARIALYGYSDVGAPDAMTERLRHSAHHWRDCFADSDAALAERIRADRIQVLVDLAGHTANNRLPVFARRAAPVQVTWLGYGATTGLPQMDYRLADPWTDPPGEPEDWWTETLYHLPGGAFCFTPPDDIPLPEATSEPGAEDRPPTFGSFNNLSKTGDAVIALWARVLQEVAGSRLLLKARQLADPATGERVRAAFAAQGIDPGRIEFAGRTESRAAHLALYGALDVALDSFPYNGATTTCEALWMGTPVVTLAGDRSVGRYGKSILTQTGCGDWVAETPDQFVAIASALAQNRPDRATLRARLASSPLTDATRAARELEDAFETMWRHWLVAQK